MTAHPRHTSRFGEQAGSVLYSQWNEFCRLRKVVLAHHDTDSIHDLRVASRRMRATLGLFRTFIPAKIVKRISKDMRGITRALGHVRNIDEAIIYVSALPPFLPILLQGLRRARVEEATAVIRVLKDLPHLEMDKAVRAAVADLSGGSDNAGIDLRLPTYLSECSLQRYQQLQDLLAPAIFPENVEQRHGLRIAIKKWRYLLEASGQVCGQDYGPTLETLKEYQTLLGSLNDMVEFAALSASLSLPAEECQELKVALERDTKLLLDRFIVLAAARPLQYTFLL